MERTVSVEERIKRAEEIYQRRKSQGVRVSSNTVNIGNRPSLSLFKKMTYKIAICIIIYLVLYFIKNSNYIFSQDLINQTNQILSYDMNIQSMYNNVVTYFEKFNINEFFDIQSEENKENTKNDNKENETRRRQANARRK